MNTDKNTAKMLVPMARAFGYSVGRLRQTPRNADTLKVPRFFCAYYNQLKVYGGGHINGTKVENINIKLL